MQSRFRRHATRLAGTCGAMLLLSACSNAPVSSLTGFRLARVPVTAEVSVRVDSANGRAVITQRVVAAAGDSVFWSIGATDGSSPQAFTSAVLHLGSADGSRTVFDDMSSGVDFPFRNYTLGRPPTVALRAGAYSEATIELIDRDGQPLQRGRYRATVVSLVVGSSRIDNSGARAMQALMETFAEFTVP
jgi:hypothetical protein